MVLLTMVTTWLETWRKFRYNFKRNWRFHIVESRLLLVNHYTFSNFDEGRFRPMNNSEIILSYLMTCCKGMISYIFVVENQFWMKHPYALQFVSLGDIRNYAYRLPTVSGIALRTWQFVCITAAQHWRYHVLKLEKKIF